ncbi:hypothetical protein CARUB_v10005374mg [Capsella rubella]|uniref:Avr9/Cf-9 rapidly elicited protein n=1 Tax=Capsella rubella TaxID=81985 RepID=R0GJQ6_9BRAS|nr:putative protein TPRXL [Capsella rubella]EOA17114.1 hypothetical protein CARUB_v10005374mg [Capsella rubella]
MEIKVKPTTMMATKEEDDIKMKKMKDCVVIGQESDHEEVSSKEQETMKILDGESKQSQDEETRQADSKITESPSSSSSSSTTSLEMHKKLEIEKNFTSQKITKKEENHNNNVSNMMNKHKKTSSSHVWDCGSSLYDSFELNSFKRQLDSAISASSARTMSMSRLPDRRLPPLISSLSPENPPLPTTSSSSSSSSGVKKHSNKISRSLQRFLKSVFKPKQQQSSSSTPSSPVYKALGRGGGGGDKERYYVVYDKSGSLTTIPESTEKEAVSPEINSLVRKTVSERFPASRVVGISCA